MAKTIYHAQRIRQAREAKGMSRQQLADATLFKLNTIASIEKGTAATSERALRSIAEALEQPYEYFIDLNYQASTILHSIGAEDVAPKTVPIDEAVIDLETAEALVQAQQYQAALEKLDEIDRRDIGAAQRRIAYFLRAQSQMRLRPPQTDAARYILEELEKESTPGQNERPPLTSVVFEIGNSYAIERANEKAIECYERCLALLTREGALQSSVLGFQVYTELGRLWRKSGDLQQAAKYFEAAESHPAAVKDDYVHANLLLSQGLALKEQGRHTEAFSKLAQSQKLYEKNKLRDTASEIASYRQVMAAEDGGGNLQQGFLPSLTETDLISTASQIIVLTNRASVLRLRGDSQQAAQEIDRVMHLLKAAGTEIEPETVADVYHEAALVHAIVCEWDLAFADFREALATLKIAGVRWSVYERIYKDYINQLIIAGRSEELLTVMRDQQAGQKAALIV